MIQFCVNENIEIASAVALFLKRSIPDYPSDEYDFMYIPRMEKELDFIKDTKTFVLTKEYIEKHGLAALFVFLFNAEYSDGYIPSDEELVIIDSYVHVQADESWTAWRNQWKRNFSELCLKMETLFKRLVSKDVYDYCFGSGAYKVVFPLIVSEQIFSAVGCVNGSGMVVMTNFGKSFEELYISLNCEEGVFETVKSEILLCLSAVIKQYETMKSDMKKGKMLFLSDKKADGYLKMKLDLDLYFIQHVSWYNYIITNDRDEIKSADVDEKALIESLSFCRPDVFCPGFKEMLRACDVLLIGEIHGMAEHENYLCENLMELYTEGYEDIIFEVPSDLQETLNTYLEGRTDSIDKGICAAHNLITAVRMFNRLNCSSRLRIHCVDEPLALLQTENWDTGKREEIMAANSLKVLQTARNKVLGIFGNYHVQKNKLFQLERKEVNTTLCQKLISATDKKISVINIFGFHGAGKVGPYNCRIRKYFAVTEKTGRILYNIEKLAGEKVVFIRYAPEDSARKPFFMSATGPCCLLPENILPVDGTLIFPEQTVADWISLYEQA